MPKAEKKSKWCKPTPGKSSNLSKSNKQKVSKEEKQKKRLEEFQEFYAELIESGQDLIICWTDGACKGNPGPAGSACVINFASSSLPPFENREFIGENETNNIAELRAIQLVLEGLKSFSKNDAKYAKEIKNNPIWIFTDSEYAYNILVGGWKAKLNIDLIKEIKLLIEEVKSMLPLGQLNFHLVPAHCKISGNELADALANLAIEENS